MSKSKNKSYYKFSDDKIIFSSNLSKRFWARALDFLIAGLIGKLILTIFSNVATPSIPKNPPLNSLPEYVIAQFNPVMMIGWSLCFLGILFTLWIYPMFFNRKYPGQTFGKKIFKITPMYLHENKFYKSFILRESFVSLLLLFSFLLIIINGIDSSYVNYKYDVFRSSFSTIPNSLPPSINQWNFILNIWNDQSIMFSITATQYMVVISFIQKIIYITWFVLLIILFFTIAFNPSKRGMHDFISETVVVDLRTITKEKDFLIKLNIIKPLNEEKKDIAPAILKK